MPDVTRDVVFFFDCDNTLLDNDQMRVDLDAFLERELGAAVRERYWEFYEQLRVEFGYADYLGAVQRLRNDAPGDASVFQLSSFLLDYPFERRVYPGTRGALAACAARGTTAILSDGDAVFQPRKLHRAGLWDAFEGRVLIYVHKEKMLDDVLRRYPAEHYVMVDDKLPLLAAMKAILGNRLTTVWPRQGHYALDAKYNAGVPAPDVTIDHIGELAAIDLSTMLAKQHT